MRILFVVHDFLPKHLAGTELYTYNIAKALQHRGHEVSIYAREYGHFEDRIREEDTHYDGIKVKLVYFNASEKRFQFLRNFHLDFYNPILERHFCNFLDQIKPDVIHVQHLIGLSVSFIGVAKRKSIPVVLTLNDYWFICSRIQLLTPDSKVCSGPSNGLKCPRCLGTKLKPLAIWGLYPLHSFLFFLRTAFLRRMLKQVDLIIAPSNFLRDKFIQHGVSEERIIFSDYGLKSPNANFGTRKLRSRNGTRRFAFIGSIMPHKGVHVLVEAFNQLNGRSAELRVYGDPGYAPSYYEQVNLMATNPNIRFMGHFDNNRVFDILAETDVLVVPSIWYENSPLTMHEAAIAGVPVIASNIGGMAELIERMRNGLLFRVGDPTDLCSKMKLLVDKPELVDELAGRPTLVRTLEENASELEGIYSSLSRDDRI